MYMATELFPEMLPTVPKWSARMPHRLAHSIRLLISIFKCATYAAQRGGEAKRVSSSDTSLMVHSAALQSCETLPMYVCA